LRPSSGLTEPQNTVRSGSRLARSAQASQGDRPSRNRSVSGSGMATSISVSDCSYTISRMSDGVHCRKNSSGGSFGWSSGVSALWNAYR